MTGTRAERRAARAVRGRRTAVVALLAVVLLVALAEWRRPAPDPDPTLATWAAAADASATGSCPPRTMREATAYGIEKRVPKALATRCCAMVAAMK